MSTIPLLRLPSFAQDIIVSSLDAAQVLGITLRSKVMHRIVSRSKYSKAPVAQMTVHRGSIKILTIIDPDDSFSGTPRRFWSVKDVDCDRFRNGFYVIFNNHREKFVTEHLLSVFNISQFKVSVKTGYFEELTIFDHVKKFIRVCLELMNLTTSQLNFLLEDIETDSLILRNISDIPEYRRDFVFNHRYIIIVMCPNIPFSSILSMKSENLTVLLNSTDSTIQDLVGFMEKWISGGMEHLKRLQIIYRNLTDDTEKSVFQEIDQMNVVVNQRMFSSGRGVIRPDRKQASVWFYEGMFHFATF